MHGLRYGTIPFVALTGGLADTIINASPPALTSRVSTGIQFHRVTAAALRGPIVHLCHLYRDREVWTRMQANAMAQPVGWHSSAKAYARLFQDVTRRA